VLGALCFGWPLLHGTSFAQTAARESAAARYQRLYEEARKCWLAQSNSVEPAWKFAAACFDWAELASSDTQRADLAKEGIHAARRAIARDPASAPACYYLALDLGQLAQTKLLGALKLVSEMEAMLKRSVELDPIFDYAGAHRTLGMLYRDAPGWPTSLGDRAKARFHLKQAVELSPAYPDNQLALLEARLKWGEKKSVSEQIPQVESILQKARGQLAGEAWRLAWQDWDKRWEKIKSRADDFRF
jgi:tetratricopeptide (TPR) repeat protein